MRQHRNRKPQTHIPHGCRFKNFEVLINPAICKNYTITSGAYPKNLKFV